MEILGIKKDVIGMVSDGTRHDRRINETSGTDEEEFQCCPILTHKSNVHLLQRQKLRHEPETPQQRLAFVGNHRRAK